jgi:hypothetical protein
MFQQMGFGVTVALLVATLIRIVILPSAPSLLGPAPLAPPAASGGRPASTPTPSCADLTAGTTHDRPFGIKTLEVI